MIVRLNGGYDSSNVNRFLFHLAMGDTVAFGYDDFDEEHHLIKNLNGPGIILFSSGSTGTPKVILHDAKKLLSKYKKPGKARNMLAFMRLDHIGGINTFFYSIASGGHLFAPVFRDPESVCYAVQEHEIEVLPVTPTFLTMLLLSKVYGKYDMSSLKLITYGTEPMPESTLKAATYALPEVEFKQTYGLSEVGILQTKTRANDSLWVKVGGEGYQTRVVDGLLEIKSDSAMVGYLNAPSPFTEDGYFKTGDAVEQDGEWIKILGRKSELINVGGEKLYPAEVESVLQEMDGVESAVVTGVPHELTGQIVQASVKLKTPEAIEAFRKRMRAHCQGRLDRYKIPQKVVFVDSTHSDRFKKTRVPV